MPGAMQPDATAPCNVPDALVEVSAVTLDAFEWNPAYGRGRVHCGRDPGRGPGRVPSGRCPIGVRFGEAFHRRFMSGNPAETSGRIGTSSILALDRGRVRPRCGRHGLPRVHVSVSLLRSVAGHVIQVETLSASFTAPTTPNMGWHTPPRACRFPLTNAIASRWFRHAAPGLRHPRGRAQAHLRSST